jgi:HEAT repeat protein
MKNQLIAATVLMLAPVFAAASTTTETAQSTLETALQARNPDVRKDAVQALAILGSQASYQARLESMLSDKDVPVRLAVVAALAELKDADALRQALDDSTPEVRFAAAKALYAMNDPEGEQALLRVLAGTAKTSSGLIAEQKREALRLLQTPKALMMMAINQGAGMVPLPYFGTGFMVMEKIVAGPKTSNRAATALMLGKSNNPEVIAALENALGDKDARVRAAAIQAIGMSGNADLAKDAEPMLNDKNRSVRVRAAACYLRLTSITQAAEITEE